MGVVIESVFSLIDEYRLSDIASLAGVLISVIGFGATLINLAKTSSAAKRAELAATETQKSIRLFDTVADASRVVSMLDEARRLNRAKEWKVLLDRLGDIKKILITINVENKILNPDQAKSIQSSVSQVSIMENVIEKAISEGIDPDDPVQISKTISKQIEKIYIVLNEVKRDRKN